MLFLLVFVVEHIGSLETAVFCILDISVSTGAFSVAGLFSIKDIIACRLVAHTGVVAEAQSFGNVESQSAIGLESA